MEKKDKGKMDCSLRRNKKEKAEKCNRLSGKNAQRKKVAK